MKKDPGLVFRLCLVVGDALAIVSALAFAYVVRTHFDSRSYVATLVDFDFGGARSL